VDGIFWLANLFITLHRNKQEEIRIFSDGLFCVGECSVQNTKATKDDEDLWNERRPLKELVLASPHASAAFILHIME